MRQELEYRQRIYDTYVSKKLRPEGKGFSEEDYQRWASAARVRLRGWLPIDCNTPILDMGCGPGYFLYMLDRLGYTNLTGVDLSPEQVALARQWCPRATIIKGDVREVLAQNPDHFGLISGFDFIEHFRKDEIVPLLKLIAKALLPGERVILQTPNAESPWGLMYRYGDFTHEIAFDPHSLNHLLCVVGCVDFRARECGPYIHGVKSFFRFLVWQCIKTFLLIWNLAETGTIGSGIYTRVFCSSANKQEVKH